MTTQTVVGGRTYEFGLKDRLRIARELSGHGQRELALLTGISRGSIANYENGTTTPRRPQLIAWAMATGFSLEWLETGQVTPEKSPDGRGHRVTRALLAQQASVVTLRDQSGWALAPNRTSQRLAA